MRPAFNNDFFISSVEEITSRWSQDIFQALLDHYEAILAEAKEKIASTPMPHELLEKSLRVVTSWARRQLGRKLTDCELDDALQLINSTQLLDHSSSAGVGLEHSLMPAVPSHRPPEPVNRATQTTICTSMDTWPLSECATETAPAPLEDTVPQQEEAGTPLEAPVDLAAPTSRPAADDGSTVVDLALLNNHTTASRPQEEGELTSATQEPSDVVSLESDCTTPFTDIKDSIVCGDKNVSDFTPDKVTIISDEGGRLFHFKSFFRKVSDRTFKNVSSFIFCLSLLDKNNLPITNFNNLRTVLYNIRRIFPNATLHVLLCGEPSDDPCINNICKLNDIIRERLPANCKILEPPHPFSSTNALWDRSTRDSIFQILHSTLNL